MSKFLGKVTDLNILALPASVPAFDDAYFQ
jgi:hypothetical protein